MLKEMLDDLDVFRETCDVCTLHVNGRFFSPRLLNRNATDGTPFLRKDQVRPLPQALLRSRGTSRHGRGMQGLVGVWREFNEIKFAAQKPETKSWKA